MLLWLPLGSIAQPGAPPLFFVLVENERGREKDLAARLEAARLVRQQKKAR